MIEKKNIIFAGRKLNWDDDLDIMPSGDSRDRLDIVYPDGNINVIESRRELNLVIADTLSGTSTCIGSCPDVENNAIIYALYNASNNHSIYRIARTGSGYTRTLISTSSAWGFSLSYPIKDMFVIGTGSEAMLFMTDGYNPQRLFNIANMIAGSYSAMTEAQINLLKPAPTKRPAVSVTDDAIYDRNNIDRKTFQFAYKYIYDTGQKTQLSHYSDLVYDYGRESVSGDFDPTKGENNRILVTSYRDWINVDKIELYVRIGDIGSGTLGSWKLYDTIETSGATGGVDYYFYNDKEGSVPTEALTALYDDIPLTSQCAKAVFNRIVLGQNNTGYDNVDIDIDLLHVRGTLVPYNTNIYYNTEDPYITNTDIDITYVANERMTINVIICKVTGIAGTPAIDSYESYYYIYENASSDNETIVDRFVDDINFNTAYGSDITASKLGASAPYKLRIANTDYLNTNYYVYSLSAPFIQNVLTFKENSNQNIAICYYDTFNRSGRALVKDMGSVYMEPYNSGNHAGYYPNFIKYTINHLPPSWAVCYQFMWARSDIVNHFTIPILVQSQFGESKDITEDGVLTRVNIDAALDRAYTLNETSNLNNFDLQEGDRARVLAYIPDESPIYLAEYIDVEVLGIDTNGYVLLPNFSNYAEYEYWGTTTGAAGSRSVYLFEFYRLGAVTDEEDLVYYEVGDVLAISGGYHQASTVTGSGVSAQNQTAVLPAIGIINFGDTYRFYHHYGSRFVDTNISAIQDYDIIPMIANVESITASFNYDSRALGTGRFNFVDDNYGNRDEETLIYGGLYRSDELRYNDVNSFTNDPLFLNNINGNIVGIELKGYTLQVYQESKITSIPVLRIETQLPDGSTSYVATNEFFGTERPLPYEVGCSDRQSMATNLYSTYFYDSKTSAWYRLSQNGLLNITEANDQNIGAFKMKAYGIYLSKLINDAIKDGDDYYIRSGYDPVKDMYIFTYVNNDSASDNVTIGFHEPTNAWLSFYSYKHEQYFSLNQNRFFSFTAGDLYEHHVNSAYVTTGYIQIHFNEYGGNVKVFRNIEVHADQPWVPSTEGDITIHEDATAFQDGDSYEWSYAEMSSLLRETHFHNYENVFMASFLRNMLNKKGVSVGRIGLVNGELLRGKTINIILRNTKSTVNKLKAIAIGFENSK